MELFSIFIRENWCFVLLYTWKYVMNSFSLWDQTTFLVLARTEYYGWKTCKSKENNSKDFVFFIGFSRFLSKLKKNVFPQVLIGEAREDASDFIL